jgi:L-lactate dehydrogenase complex protein LldF
LGRALGRRIRRAVRDPVLRRNVLRATDTSLLHRAEVVSERPDWEELKARATAIRGEVLVRLDRYLDEFTENATRRGVRVHRARDGRAACRIVTELARRKGCSRILKAKSMVTEEVELNRAFERRGFAPLETDLGEYIVQLADEPPSHITAPALHRSAEQIRDLFLKEGVLEGLGPPPGDRKALARWLSLAAREHLRPRLLDADLGITGANFLVAETGTVVLVENEGNIRFTTTTPPVQVVLVGIEKVVPRLEDLSTLLPLLTGSATGQRATTYVSLITGPLEELDVVLLDNGRSRLMADPEDREALKCIRCGACMNVCPVYRTVGGHAYGWTYPGPIGALLSPLLRRRREDRELPFASSLCGACSEICPVGIDLADHLLRLRNRWPGGPFERAALRLFGIVMARASRYRLAFSAARRLESAAHRLGLLRGWTRHREPPRLAPRSFREQWRLDGRSAS